MRHVKVCFCVCVCVCVSGLQGAKDLAVQEVCGPFLDPTSLPKSQGNSPSPGPGRGPWRQAKKGEIRGKGARATHAAHTPPLLGTQERNPGSGSLPDAPAPGMQGEGMWGRGMLAV